MRYLTVSETAEALHLSVPTIKRYIYDGKLKSTKLPGGQHRIAESEIERLLSPDEAPPHEVADKDAADATTEERLAVLERWVTELEADMEKLSAGLSVISRYCERAQETLAEAPVAATPHPAEPEHRVQVLGPGCKRCDALYELTARVLQDESHEGVHLERTTDLDDIAAFGPVLTPALVIDGQLVLTGRIPSEATLRKLLARHLE
jgi:excisionase family DNA binding protein